MPRDLQSLYRDIVVEHGAHPRNEGPLVEPTHEGSAENPLCGDRVSVRLRVSGDRILEARFEAKGCLISRASASLLTEIVTGRSTDEALALATTMTALVNDDSPPDDAGPLEPLRGVRDFPARGSCATLAWDTLAQALASRLEGRASR